MNTLIESLLGIHVVAGSISLILFWIPAFTKKGGEVHRKVGRWYVYMMWIVVITAMILSIKNGIIGNVNVALFLGFVSLITANPLWYGSTVLKHKKKLNKQFLWTHRLLSLALVLFGIFMILYGTIYVETGIRYLMWFFGVVGFTGLLEIYRSYKYYEKNSQWFKRHYVGMISTGIAAYTAFFAFGGRVFLSKILSNEWQLIPWIAPTIIGVFALQMLNRKYFGVKKA